jgi:glycosyltransferase involved in cell wall biosynthesis
MTSRPLRVAFVAACPYPWPRGTPVRIHQMALALARRGHDVHVVTYHLGEAVAARGLKVHRIDDVAGYRRTGPGPTLRKLIQLDPMLARLLGRLHRDVGFDVVHAHHYEGVLVAAAARVAIPVVYDAHTTLGGELPLYSTGLPRALARRIGVALDARLPGLADRTVAVSESVRDTLLALRALAPDAIDVIPNGIEVESFPVAWSPSREPRPVIFTGNLAPYQRIDLLLDAFARLRARRPGVRLSIVTGDDFSPYEGIARRLGVREAIDVRAAPFPEQPALLAAAALAVNPRTDCDGLPQKLLNYMAAGMPIVSSDGSAVHLEHESSGLRVANGDAGAMAAAMERLLEDPALALALGKAARERVLRDFSWSTVAERVEEIYLELLRTARGRRAPRGEGALEPLTGLPPDPRTVPR